LFNQTSTKDRPEDPDVGYYKVRSFKIEPNETEPGSWVVDGEAMDEYKTLRADVLPGRGRFFYSSATAN
jgi:diacylglycerol kinase family enzyme